MEPHLSPSLTPQHKNITESQIEIVASLYFLFLCLEIDSQDIDKVATPSRFFFTYTYTTFITFNYMSINVFKIHIKSFDLIVFFLIRTKENGSRKFYSIKYVFGLVILIRFQLRSLLQYWHHRSLISIHRIQFGWFFGRNHYIFYPQY